MLQDAKDLDDISSETTTWNLDQFDFEHDSIVTVFEVVT